MTTERRPVTIIRSMGGLVFDAVFEERHESALEVTDSPLETGVVVSDHAYMKPLSVTLSAGVSDVVLNGDGRADAFASDASRSIKAFGLLTELQAKAEPFDLQTGLKLYKNMICTSIRTSQDKDTASVLVFEAVLREVLIVYTQKVNYPARKAGATRRQAGAKKHKGEQQGKEVDESKKKSSLLSKLSAALKGK